MDLINLMIDQEGITVKVDKDLIIKGISTYVYNSQFKDMVIDKHLKDVLNQFVYTKEFKNARFADAICNDVKHCFENNESIVDEIIVTNDYNDTTRFYEMDISYDIITVESGEHVVIRVTNFKRKEKSNQIYEIAFRTYIDEFPVIKKMSRIGSFVIDLSVSENLVYANDDFTELMNLKPTLDSTYVINPGSSHKNNDMFINSEGFLLGIKMLKDDLSYYTNEWETTDKWIKMEAKILKNDDNGNPRLIGGIIYDISDYRMYQDTEYLKSIYELAITSGGIGIFHYDLNKHTNEYFEANDIYAKMIGLEPNDTGFYETADFQKALMELEEEISDNESINKKLQKLLQGNIDGTTDDIIKIKNLKSNEIKYLLSSSKIESRFEDGSPYKFGGICIDITERIMQEKNQIAFAYKDELTHLHNNRKLIKDMSRRKDGLGMFLDLDDFKKINDRHGHLVGNKALKLFARALLDTAKTFDNIHVYRMYGDEFFVFAEGAKDNIVSKFEKLLVQNINVKMEKRKYDFHLEASLGYAVYKENSDIDDFIKACDYSMYKTKIRKKSLRSK